jgi:hypothetical protein
VHEWLMSGSGSLRGVIAAVSNAYSDIARRVLHTNHELASQTRDW